MENQRARAESAEARCAAKERECEELRAALDVGRGAPEWAFMERSWRKRYQDRAETAEAKIQRVMEWARGRCECCHWNCALPGNGKPDCNACSDNGKPNWTPPQAWEGK